MWKIVNSVIFGCVSLASAVLARLQWVAQLLAVKVM